MGVRIDGSNDVVSAVDGTLTVDGLSLNVAGIITASGGFKVGSAVTISSNGNATFSGITTFGNSVHLGIGVSVGVGTDIPEHALVVRDTGLARLRIRNDTASSENYASLNLKTAGFDNGWSVYSEYKSSDADNYLKIFKGDGTATHMYFQDPNEVGIRSAFYHVDANGDDQGDSCFGFIANSANPGFKVKSGGIERFRITSGGDVGIGTDNPAGNLEIDASSTTDMIMLDVAGTNFARLGHNSASGTNILDVRSEGHTRFLTNGNNERVRITSDGQVRIGSFGSASNKNSVTPLSHVDGSGVNGGFQVNRHTSVGGGGAQLMLTATRGSGISSHTVLQDNDGIGTLVFAGSDGGEFVTGAEIQAVVDGTPGDDDLPTELIFRTNSGGGSATDAMRISAGADLLLGGHSARTYDDTGDSNTILDIYNSTANKRGILSLSGNTNGSSSIGTIWFNNDYNSSSSPGSTMKLSAAIQAQGVTSDSNAGDDAGAILQFLTKPEAGSLAERMRIDSAGRLMVGKTTAGVANDGAELRTGVSDYAVVATAGGHIPMIINRNTDDGGLLRFRQANTDEGTVSVSGGTVTYGQFCGSHWGRLEDNSKPEILPGTILETINKAVEWKVIEFTVDGEQKRQAYNGSEENGASVTVEYEGVSYTGTVADEEPDSENLNKHVCVKVSDTAASKAVFGVFLGWDTDESDNIIGTWNDMNIAAIGNYFIRIKSGQSLEIGDLIESDGTGCGVVQSDDIIRSKTVAKVTSTTSHQVYADGSFLVTCVLYSG